MKFLVDHMLGKLAKYLRFMGYDTYYPERGMDDDMLLQIAKKEGRIIITRDKELAKRSNGLYVASEDYIQQLKIVIKTFNLNDEHMLSRCSICNEILVPIEKDEVKDKVPPYVYEHNDEFYRCPKCGRIYWWGTHTQRIESTIREIMGDENEDRREGER